MNNTITDDSTNTQNYAVPIGIGTYSNTPIGIHQNNLTGIVIIGGSTNPNESNQVIFNATSRNFDVENEFKVLGKDELINLENKDDISDNKKETEFETKLIAKEEEDHRSLEGAMFLRNNNGVFVEVPGKPNLFLDVTQEILELKNKVAHLTEIVEQLYYAPGGPGFLMAESDFETLKERLGK